MVCLFPTKSWICRLLRSNILCKNIYRYIIIAQKSNAVGHLIQINFMHGVSIGNHVYSFSLHYVRQDGARSVFSYVINNHKKYCWWCICTEHFFYLLFYQYDFIFLWIVAPHVCSTSWIKINMLFQKNWMCMHIKRAELFPVMIFLTHSISLVCVWVYLKSWMMLASK